jgi:uncharacterized protein (TIGR02147 family)
MKPAAMRVQHQPYHTLLQDTFAERRQKNPSYSLRAFARDLSVSPTALSQVLSYQRDLSPKNLARVADRLALSPEKANSLKRSARFKPTLRTERRILEEDVFHLMSDWYYFGILSLARTPKCKNDPHWIANRFAISVVEARVALERLERLRLIKRNGRNVERTSVPLTTTEDIPSAAGRKLQRQHLSLAQDALDEVPISEREIVSMTMAIDRKKIKPAKAMILEFRDELCDFLESGTKENVYVLGIQLFPVEKFKKGDA